MTSSYTTNKSLEKPANGDYVDTWEVPVNSDMDVIDQALGSTTSLNATSGSAALTATQYRSMRLYITGSISSGVVYTIPSGVGGQWIIDNATSGAGTITIASAGAGTSVVCAQGKRTQVFSDGANINLSDDNRAVPAGSNTQIQYNNSGAFGASSTLTWSGSTLTATGTITNGTVSLGSNSITASGGTLTSASNLNVAGTVESTTGGFKFPDGTTQTTAADVPSGTVMLFAQTSAPAGWTKSTTHNNKALRVVSGTASSGGSVAFTTAFSSQNVGATTLTLNQLPSHSHLYTAPTGTVAAGSGASSAVASTATQLSGSTGGSYSHTHSINIAVQYVDVIIATKN